MEGIGILYFNDGKPEYDGEWKKDEYDGWGTQYTNSNSSSKWISYEGYFKNGLKEGRGKM
jgi:hypothetical protein